MAMAMRARTAVVARIIANGRGDRQCRVDMTLVDQDSKLCRVRVCLSTDKGQCVVEEPELGSLS